MAKVNYKNIPHYLENRLSFEGNSMRGVRETIKGSELPFGRGCELPKDATYLYVVYSYGTPIAGITDMFEVVICDSDYSVTTKRHKNLCLRYLVEDS